MNTFLLNPVFGYIRKILPSAFTLCLFHVQGQSVLKHGDADPDVTLHVSHGINMCDFDIAPELTQSDWRRATREVGSAIYLEPLTSSRPLGKYNWSAQLETNSFHVDQESGAWNHTFHHPDSTHYLTGESGRLMVPGVRFRIGLTERLDVGVYYTSAKPFGANYGFLGFDGKYTFLNQDRGWSAAVRASYAMDAAIKDFNISAAGFELLAGRQIFRVFTPYAGLTANWYHGKERTDEVMLRTENLLGCKALLGIQFRWKFVDVAYECQFGDGMNQRSLKIGVTF